MMRVRNLVAGAAVILALGVVSAHADDDDDPTFEQKVIRSLMGGGAARPDIDYRERSPLVIPPAGAQGQLPPPDAGARTREMSAWPKDPDKERRKNKGGTGITGAFEQLRSSERPLTPGEIRQGRQAGAGRVTQPARRSEAEHGSGRPLTPAEMGDTRTLFGIFGSAVTGGSKEAVTFKGEPTRRSLTDPPTGYQTPSSAQPYQPPPGTGLLGRIPTFFDRGTDAGPGSGAR